MKRLISVLMATLAFTTISAQTFNFEQINVEKTLSTQSAGTTKYLTNYINLQVPSSSDNSSIAIDQLKTYVIKLALIGADEDKRNAVTDKDALTDFVSKNGLNSSFTKYEWAPCTSIPDTVSAENRWNDSISVTPLPTVENSVLYYRLAESYFAGGAHGTSTIRYVGIDMKSGTRVNPTTYFDLEKQKSIIKLISTAVGVQKYIINPEKYNVAKFTEMARRVRVLLKETDAPFTFPTFYISNDTLYITFQPYEIGPYTYGIISFNIPMSDINPKQNNNNRGGNFRRGRY